MHDNELSQIREMLRRSMLKRKRSALREAHQQSVEKQSCFEKLKNWRITKEQAFAYIFFVSISAVIFLAWLSLNFSIVRMHPRLIAITMIALLFLSDLSIISVLVLAIIKFFRQIARVDIDTLNRISNELDSSFEEIYYLSKYPSGKRKLFRQQIASEVKRIESVSQMLQSLSPFIVILYIVLFAIIFGFPVDPIDSIKSLLNNPSLTKTKEFFNKVGSLSVLTGLSIPIVRLLIDITNRQVSAPLNKFLLLLDQAEDLASRDKG